MGGVKILPPLVLFNLGTQKSKRNKKILLASIGRREDISLIDFALCFQVNDNHFFVQKKIAEMQNFRRYKKQFNQIGFLYCTLFEINLFLCLNRQK